MTGRLLYGLIKVNNNKLKRSIQAKLIHSNYICYLLQKLSLELMGWSLELLGLESIGLELNFVDRNKHLEEAFKDTIGC